MIHSRLRLPGFVAAVVIVLGGCSDNAERRAEEIGQRATNRLMTALKSELMAAMKDGGPPAAVDICAERAQELTLAVTRELEIPALAIKRTGLRIRNPRNAPDSAERAALEDYERRAAAGEELVPRLVATADGYRYFSPIRTARLCLACHGSRDEIDTEVAAVVARHYPEDRAVGFALGELRGVVSVTIPAAAAGD